MNLLLLRIDWLQSTKTRKTWFYQFKKFEDHRNVLENLICQTKISLMPSRSFLFVQIKGVPSMRNVISVNT